MSEDEMKTKWCPMVRVVVTENGDYATNRFDYVNDPWTRCIGSACAMWVPEERRVQYNEETQSNEMVVTGGRCGLVR